MSRLKAVHVGARSAGNPQHESDARAAASSVAGARVLTSAAISLTVLSTVGIALLFLVPEMMGFVRGQIPAVVLVAVPRVGFFVGVKAGARGEGSVGPAFGLVCAVELLLVVARLLGVL